MPGLGTSCGRSYTMKFAGLPDKYRIPVILSYLEGKTNEEVAELLHWPVGTVKVPKLSSRAERCSDRD